MSKEVTVLIPLMEKEMEEVDNLSNPILKVIINSTVKATLEAAGLEPDSIKTVITRFLIRENKE